MIMSVQLFGSGRDCKVLARIWGKSSGAKTCKWPILNNIGHHSPLEGRHESFHTWVFFKVLVTLQLKLGEPGESTGYMNLCLH